MEENKIIDVETIDKNAIMKQLIEESITNRKELRKSIYWRRNRCKKLHPKVGDKYWMQWQKVNRLKQLLENEWRLQ